MNDIQDEIHCYEFNSILLQSRFMSWILFSHKTIYEVNSILLQSYVEVLNLALRCHAVLQWVLYPA